MNVKATTTTFGFCFECRHWEEIANELGYCFRFQKRADSLSGTHCTAWEKKPEPGAKPDPE